MPLVVTAAIAGSITVVNGTFTLIQNCYKLAAVDEDLAICLELLANADRDINYARRQLWSRKSTHDRNQFSATDFAYFETAIEKLDEAALSLGRLVQCYRVQKDQNSSISIGSKFKWVLQGKDKFANRKDVLMMAHSSLGVVIQRLGNVTPYNPQFAPPPPSYDPPSYPQSTRTQSYSQLAPLRETKKILRSPSQQRALRGKSSMLLRPEDKLQQQPTVTVSEIRQSDQKYSAPSLPSVPRESDMPRSRYGSRIDSVAEESEFGEHIGNY